MNPQLIGDYLEYSRALGSGFVVLIMAALIAAWICQWAWAWIDDEDRGEHNWAVKKINKAFGLVPKGNKYVGVGEEEAVRENNKKFDWCEPEYRRLKTYSSDAAVWSLIVASLAIPATALFLVAFWQIAATLGTLVTIAYSTRGTRRLAKKLNKHIGDKDAHK